MIPIEKMTNAPRTAGVSPWVGATHGLTPAVLGAFVILLSVVSGQAPAADWLLGTAWLLKFEQFRAKQGARESP